MPSWKILASVQLHDQPSQTRQSINGVGCNAFTRLKIATDEEGHGYYLLHVCSNGRGTDTWHATLDEAFEQAAFEFGVKPHEWRLTSDEPAR